MRKGVATIGLSLFLAIGGTSFAFSQNHILGEAPSDYRTYGDVPFDPRCMYWDWQERSWYDACAALRRPLPWRYRRSVVLRTRG